MSSTYYTYFSLINISFIIFYTFPTEVFSILYLYLHLHSYNALLPIKKTFIKGLILGYNAEMKAKLYITCDLLVKFKVKGAPALLLIHFSEFMFEIVH